ncbi:hypothetical protein BZG36_04337 [Bifiguratus adelaidae]|uniref:Extracellular metalloproteinase n=1 Tax=Bifiguratus adelaidae TaxID=1938954 RepID=A0A261XW32_9FUNG|nr:hypothetical protein BZG36_04337 [Bifiguratus adelaidae]
MVGTRSLAITAAISLLLASPTIAGPIRPPTHRNGVESFGPVLRHATYETPRDTLGEYLTRFAQSIVDPVDPQAIAVEFAKQSGSDFVVKNAYTSEHNGVTHVYLRQVVDGLEVVNGDMNINVDADGRIISHGASFYRPHPEKGYKFAWQKSDQHVVHLSGASSRKSGTVMSPIEAYQFLAGHLHMASNLDEITIESSTSHLHGEEPQLMLHNVPEALSPVPVKQALIQGDDGQLHLVWDLQVEMEDNWVHAHVDAHSGKVIQLVDWVSDATSYNIFPVGLNDPSEGEQTLVTDPHDKWASPYGWHAQGNPALKSTKVYNVTIGNNVYAHENHEGRNNWEFNYRPGGVAGENAGDLVFDFKADWCNDEPTDYVDAAVTNLFYWNNMIHDLFHRYGFNEQAGNFQEDNFGRGGKGGDAVIANAQDGSGYNNANFATPPDGQRGKMRMFMWDVTKPKRDGDLEAGIIMHEYAHGISTRLTGGPANSGCLAWGEAGGMGEGWGDFFATALRMHSGHKRTHEFSMGGWSNGGDGIRRYKYSTDMKTNPETYESMNKPGYWGVHAKGAVWAQMLFEVYWNLVDGIGFTEEWFPPFDDDMVMTEGDNKDKKPKTKPSIKHITSYGNTLALQLVVDGMKLQPCRPEFIDARDAILQAEQLLTKGKYACEIWKGFAKRGLGYGAEPGAPWGGDRTDSYQLPKACQD